MKKEMKAFKDMEPFELVDANEKNWKDDFRPDDGIRTLFNLFWQLIVNKAFDGQEKAFTANIEGAGDGLELVIAFSAGGFHPTGLYFKTQDWAEARLAAEQMSHEVFNITEEHAQGIVLKSMFGKGAG